MVTSPLASSFIPALLTAGTLGLVGLAWLLRWPKLAIIVLPLSLLAGQAIRFPLPGQGGGLLISDIAVVALLLTLLIRTPRPYYQQLFLIMPFIGWSGFLLLINRLGLGLPELLVAGAYWVRLLVYLLLIPVLVGYLRAYPGAGRLLTRSTLFSLAGVVLLGFIQFFAIPQLSVFGSGWDPHQLRIVSTWMDPNFLGAFLVIGLALTVSYYFDSRRSRSLILLAVFTSLAIILTRSRSTYIALCAALLVISPLLTYRFFSRITRPRLVLFGCLVAMSVFVGTLGLVALGDRALGVITYDPTVQLRQESLAQVWRLAQNYRLIGVGYNAYQYAALQAGLIGDFNIHSRAGADNSWLTLWVTTGWPGVLLFVIPWVVIGWVNLKHHFRSQQVLPLVAIFSFVFLFIHSQFINSFLYAHLILTLAIVSSLALASVPDKFLPKKIVAVPSVAPTRLVYILIPLIPAYLWRFNVLGIPTNLFEALVCLIFLAGISTPSIRHHWRLSWKNLPLKILELVFLFIAAAIISTLVSPVLHSSSGILKSWIITPILFAWVIYAATWHSQSGLRRATLALVISGAFTALVALSQLGTVARLRGWYDVPNSLALWLAPILVLAWWHAFTAAAHRKTYLLLSLPILVALIATQSAGGILAVLLALTVGALLWLPTSTRRRILIWVAVIITLTTLVFSVSGRLSYLLSPLTRGEPNSVSVRLQLWDVSLSLINYHPIFGLGLGQFEGAYQAELHRRFADPSQPQPLPEFVFRDPHNWVLSFWLNTGILGLISFILLNALVLSQARGSRAATQGFALGIVTILVFGFTDTVYWKNDLAASWWLFVALLLASKYSLFRHTQSTTTSISFTTVR